MILAEMLKELATSPYARDYRVQRHIVEDAVCQEAKNLMAEKMGAHDAGHMLTTIDSVLLFIAEHGVPDDLDEIINRYHVNGALKREGSAPKPSLDFLDSLWDNGSNGG